jgi:hypothetical protein
MIWFRPVLAYPRAPFDFRPRIHTRADFSVRILEPTSNRADLARNFEGSGLPPPAALCCCRPRLRAPYAGAVL